MARWPLVCQSFRPHSSSSAKPLRWYPCRTSFRILRSDNLKMGVQSHGLQVTNLQRFRRIWRRQSFQCLFASARRRNARCGDTRRQSRQHAQPAGCTAKSRPASSVDRWPARLWPVYLCHLARRLDPLHHGRVIPAFIESDRCLPSFA